MDSVFKQTWAIQNIPSQKKKIKGGTYNFFPGKFLISVYQKQGMSQDPYSNGRCKNRAEALIAWPSEGWLLITATGQP